MLNQIDSYRLFLIIITLHGFLLSALMALGQLVVNRKSMKNLLFFGLFLDFTLFEIHTLLYEAGLLKQYVVLHQLNIPAMYLLGPLLYLFSRFSMEKDFRVKRSHAFHFIPLFLSIIATAYVVIRYPVQKLKILEGYFYNSITMYITIVGSFIFLVYIVMVWLLVSSSLIWERGILKRAPSITFTLSCLLIFSIASIIDVLAFALNEKIFMEFSILILNAVIILLFLINFRYPNFYQTLQDVVEKERQKRSYLKGLDLKKLKMKLHSLMNSEELFIDEDLSLPQLAEKLGITTHQLSQYINDNLKMNFTTFVNQYRIEKAKTLLKERRDYTVLSIAFEVGFKSKSAFNAAFQKYTGMSPTQYRKNYL